MNEGQKRTGSPYSLQFADLSWSGCWLQLYEQCNEFFAFLMHLSKKMSVLLYGVNFRFIIQKI